jgi:HlyD family secretion protein
MSITPDSVTPLRPGLGPVPETGMDRALARPAAWRRHLAIACGLLVMTAILLAILPGRGFTSTQRVDARQLTVAEAHEGTFEDFIPVRAQVVPLRTVYLDAVEGGRVEKLHVEDGTEVTQGQLLVELSNTALQLEAVTMEAQISEQLNNLRTLELELSRNRLQYERDLVDIDYQVERLQRLVERRRSQAANGNIPRADFEDAETELEYYGNKRRVTLESKATDLRLQQAQLQQLQEATRRLEANLGIARHSLSSLAVRAPVDGRLTAMSLEIGQSLDKGERLGQIDDPDGYKLSAFIDEFYLGRIAVDQNAEAEVDGHPVTLRIAKIYPQVTNNEFRVDLKFDDAIPGGIRRGQTLQLRLHVGAQAQALLIPNGAFFQDTGGDWVFVVQPDGREALRRDIRTGRRNIGSIEVQDGLLPGDKVIVSSYAAFADRQRLEIDAADQPTDR